jgi:hypothetical protein
MKPITEFPVSVIEQIGYYVYLLIDPETQQVFYVGKGTGNRVFQHVAEALTTTTASDKLDKIRAIHRQGAQVEYRIHRHGLTEKEAFEIEAALIDWFTLDRLTNKFDGIDPDDRGSMPILDIIARYDAPVITIEEPSILFRVNRLFRREMTEAELYEITRGKWAIGPNRSKAKYAFAVYHGIVRQVYAIEHWEPVTIDTPGYKLTKRWQFEGKIATDLQHYVGGNTTHYMKAGAQNPFFYVKCAT